MPVAGFADSVVVLLLSLVGCVFFLAELSFPDDALLEQTVDCCLLLLWRKRDDDDEATVEKGVQNQQKSEEKEMIIRKNKK